jgi:hypothetical protein
MTAFFFYNILRQDEFLTVICQGAEISAAKKNKGTEKVVCGRENRHGRIFFEIYQQSAERGAKLFGS